VHSRDDVTIKKPEQRALMPSYRNPFGGEPEIRELERRYIEGDAKSLYPDTLACSAGAGIRAGSDLRRNVRKIFRWKLQTFLKRNWRWVAAFPDGIPDHDIEAAIRSAMVADADRPCTVVRALEAFVELPSVGIPVASAFLTWLYPRKFTVIDRQAYRALNVEFPNSLSSNEYLHYLSFCLKEAATLGTSLRTFDRALWQLGSELGRGRKRAARPPTEGQNRLAKVPRGVTSAIKLLVWGNPKWTSGKIMAALKQQGFDPKKSTVETVAADFRHSLRVLRSLGAIKEI